MTGRIHNKHLICLTWCFFYKCSATLYPQMKTSDGDGQNVSYAISHDDGLQFSIDSATGIIKQIAVIDREKEQQIRFEVQATDDGNNRNSIICI